MSEPCSAGLQLVSPGWPPPTLGRTAALPVGLALAVPAWISNVKGPPEPAVRGFEDQLRPRTEVLKHSEVLSLTHSSLILPRHLLESCCSPGDRLCHKVGLRVGIHCPHQGRWVGVPLNGYVHGLMWSSWGGSLAMVVSWARAPKARQERRAWCGVLRKSGGEAPSEGRARPVWLRRLAAGTAAACLGAIAQASQHQACPGAGPSPL